MHLSPYEISKYSDALRSKTESNLSADMLEHVEDCIECKSAILELTSLVNEIDEDRNVKPNLNRKNYSYLKAAVVAFIILLPCYYFFTQKEDERLLAVKESFQSSDIKKISSTEGKKSVNKTQLSKNNLAENDLYAPIAEYEATCGENFRSEKVEIISPTLSEKSKGIIKFNISFPKKADRSITVFNNKNEQIFHQQINDNSFIHEISLSRGLYYWKLENPSDLLYLGKFSIK